MQRRRVVFLCFRLKKGKKRENSLCLRPETAPLKISWSKEGRKKSKTFFSFFLSFVKEKNFNFNDHS